MGTNFKHTLSVALVTLAFGAFLSACGEKEIIRVEGGPKATISADATMESGALADAGEQLVSPYTFMLADKVFDMALQNDPNNMKALFYKKLLKRSMVFKGIVTRIRPFVKQHGDMTKLEENIETLPHSALRTFLLEGREDIDTTSKIQDVLVQYTQAVNEFRKFLKDNPDLELTLNLNPYLFEKTIKDEVMKSCVVINSSENQLDVECNLKDVATVKINSADAVALSQIAAGEVLYYSVFTSYSLEGIESLGDYRSDVETEEERIAKLSSLPKFGKLRGDESMSLIRSLGVDFSVAAKWALRYQQQLCPETSESNLKRKGFLFKDGICIKDVNEAQRNLALLDAALNGVISIQVEDSAGAPKNVNLDVFAMSNNPVQDLRSVFPTDFNECGVATGFGDKTLGGTFPDADADMLLQNNSERCY